MFFDSYCQRLVFGRKTGHMAAPTPTFDIFLIFPNFLRFQVLSRSATHEATRVPSLLC